MGSAATLPCLLLCIFYLAAGASAKPRYMVLIPSAFYYPYTGKVHIHLMDLDEPVRVTLHLASSHDVPNVTLEVQGSDILQLNWPRFSNISPPSEQNYAYWDLHISIEGDSLQVSEQKQVLVKFLAPGTLVQTDKDVYRPGQTVKIRIARLDPNLAPSNREIPLVAVKDPSWNSVAEWEEVTPRQGIVDLSFSLPADTDLGTYTIVVEEKRHSFSVQGYGMRRFKVLIQLPNIVTVKDEKIPLDVCGRYPSGKPFRGKAKGKMCQFHRWDGTKICVEFRGQTGKNGCFSTEIPAASFNLTNFNYENWLTAKALLIEKGSGMRHAATKKCMVMYETVAITFENNDKFYKPGIPYTGMILLKGTNGSVLKETELLLVVKAGGEKKNKTLVTDGLGRAFFELDTSGWNDEVVMHGELKDDSAASEQEDDKYPEYQTVIRYLYPFSVDSKSFMKIRRLKNKLPCDQPQKFWVDYSLDEKEFGFKLQSLDMVFLVLAKRTIVTVLRKELPAEAGLRGSFSLELPIGLKLAPAAKVLGYVLLPNGEMVADSTELKVDKCFPSKVNLSFSEQRALVGSQLLLKVQAAPGALCAVYAMDEHGPKGTISPDTVYEFIPTPSEARYYSEEYDLPPCGTGLTGIILQLPAVNCFDVPGSSWRNCRRSLWRREVPAPKPQPSTYNLLEDAGLKAVTNAQLGCKVYMRFDEDDSFLYSPERKLRDERDIGMQTDFLGTWLWELVPVGEGGSAELTVTVPDAITKWEAGMFCMSPQGLGLAPATTLTAFKPFFVELALPYAVVRHEAFTLVATVFNYLRQCLRVQVTLAETAELEVSASTDEVYGGCICADEARTFRWGVRATSLGEVNITVSTEALSSEELCGNEMPVVPAQGRMDTVIKPLLVQPGGILVEKAHNSLLCQEVTEKISLEVPENILESSQRAHVTVMGDIMGNALQNVDRLLAMPYGCGEQNMVRFAPNIYIQQYLEKSGQLHPDIRARAQGFLQSGYQRELLYKHNDGSYSAFGKSDPSGNTWLTAFVLKSFGQARAYVAIEERHITDALSWLQKKQLGTGCFLSVGTLFNNALQGGVSDELSLSAYVTAAMLELGLSPTDPTVSSALRCLEAAAMDDLYTQALLAYVLGLAGRGEQQRTRLQSLAQHSVSTEGQLHWQRKGKALPPSQPSWAAAAPAEVEMTAYVLLAYLSQPQVSSADMGTASRIVRWLSKQQNPYGGFASTQDTVVALQALAKYAALTYASNGDLVVTVTSPMGTAQDFVLNNSNRLVVQQAALPELPGLYGVRARGQGCALVQLTLRYNVPPPPSTGTFDLRVETEPRECRGDASTRFHLVLRARYTGERPATNMVVIEAKLPSGYIPDKSSVVELKRQKLVKKVEVEPDQATIYLDQLTKEEETFTFAARQDFPVRNLQPATVTLYDYYETGDRVDVAYSAPCSSEHDGQNF